VTESVRALVRLSAAVASRDVERMRKALERAAVAAAPVEIEEALLQTYLFLGYPAALQAIGEWRERTPLPPDVVTAEDPAIWPARGEQVCARVYGGQYERLRTNVARLHPDMERWMVVEGYGKVLGRPGLSLPVRELCIVALLAAQDAPHQLYSHLRGALSAGATAADVAEALELASESLGEQRALAARETWRAVRARQEA
jgi:4-carboxymuconolactone decarboxylase